MAVFLPSRAIPAELADNQLNKGIVNSDAHAYLLIQKARENRSEAVPTLKKALSVSPDLPAVYFELSKASFAPSVNGVLNSIDYFLQGIDSYFRNFWWSFDLFGSLFISLVFSFLLSLVFIIFIRLVSDLPLISHNLIENKTFAMPLLLLIVFSVISPLFFLAGTLVILSLYMRKTDRMVVYFFLIVLLASPLLFRAASFFITTPLSANMRAVVQVNESSGNAFALSSLSQSDGYADRFSYALALKRDGSFDAAISVYEDLLERKKDPKVYVNLGNCYVGLYNFREDRKEKLAEAVEQYLKAVSIKPLPSAYYNLSQVSREMFDFQRGDEYYREALARDRIAVTQYRSISGRSPNRFVIDETLTYPDLWDYALETSYKVSDFGLSLVPVWAVSVLSLGFFPAIVLFNRFRQKAYRCRKCSSIMCGKCEKGLMWGQMCPACYSSLVKLDELDVKERVARLQSIYGHQRNRRMTMKILAWLLPGAAQIYAGKILYGFILLWLFLFFLIFPFVNSVFGPTGGMMTHAYLSRVSIPLLVIVYITSNFITRQRITKGWL
jgi:tetratricopeptide (TPR) repeat protein/TM2 domain-containing membrane protein YozV